MAALERAITLEQVDDIAVAVAEHLHLDVARREDVLLDQDAIVAEARRGLAPAGGERVREVCRGIDAAHALAAAARHRLDQHRIADRVRFLLQAIGRLVVAEIAGRGRHARLLHQPLGGILQAHGIDAGGAGTDPDQPGIDHALRERGILAEEAIAGVDCLRPGLACGGDDAITDEIGFARGRGTDVHRLVRLADVQPTRIGIGKDRDRAHAERARGADDAAGDLAPIGDKERADHAATPRMLRKLRLRRVFLQRASTFGVRAVIMGRRIPVQVGRRTAIIARSRWCVVSR